MPKKGYKHTEESKRKMSEAKRGEASKIRGVPKTQAHKDKIAAALRGRRVDDSTREKMRAAKLGTKQTDEHRANISKAIKELNRNRKNKPI